LHIRCGDDIRDKLIEAGIEGDYLSVADPAWLGPPPAGNAWPAARSGGRMPTGSTCRAD
jgi:hypothetical protein